jgi:acetyl esterase/lipase
MTFCKHKELLKTMKRIVAITVAVLLVLIAIWCVVPGPTIPTLLLATGVPELALPIGAAFIVIDIGMVLLVRGRSRLAVCVLGVVTIALFATAPLRAPGAWMDANDALARAHIGAERPHPIVDVDVTHDLRVPLRDGSALALDLYRPHVAGVPPLIVTIYGGAWRFGSRAADAPLARWYAARGFAVAVIDYRHWPRFRFPVQRDDIDDALNTIALHADAWHVDRDRVALFGRSAGAQLALLTGERDQLIHVRAIVAYYAPTDLIGGWRTLPVPDPAGARQLIEGYLGGPPDAEHAWAYRAAAPLTNAHAGMPPVLAIIGARDELVRPEFQAAFARRLDALGVRNVAIELPWSNHAFDAVDGLGAAIASAATLRFLDTLL